MRLVPAPCWRWRTRGDWHALTPHQLDPLPHRSRLSAGGDTLVLPEHLLAACVLMDLDGVGIEAPQGEVPILDGSAAPFLRALRAAGVEGRRRSDFGASVRWLGAAARWSGGAELAWARTFVEAGFGRRTFLDGRFPGARPGAALVVDADGRVLGGGQGRGLGDERAAHKLLDLLGDLGPTRAAGPLRGELHAVNPSHLRNPAIIAEALRRGELLQDAA